MLHPPTVATLLLTCLLCLPLGAQIDIRGKVIDAKSGDPLPYVYLKLADVALGTVSEADGTFFLAVPAQHRNRSITFSYLGYQSTSVEVNELGVRSRAGYLTIELKPEATELTEITVVPKKLPSARAILRRVFRSIPENYMDAPGTLNGYYRETLTESGAYIKLTDAAVDYRSMPYTTDNYRWKDYANGFGGLLVMGVLSTEGSLHRIHFHHKTLKGEQAGIIDSRSSLNGSTRNMKASITGGPLSLFGRDRVKYQESFLGKKRNRDFDYLVDEVKDEDGNWIYALQFHTTTTPEDLEALSNERGRRIWRPTKRWKFANERKLLRGTLYIDPETYAVVGYECSVPNELKPYFCGYTTMAIKHFDYKLEAKYQRIGSKYYLESLRHEDEFIFKDTTDNSVTPYAAISEWQTLGVDPTATKPIPKEIQFGNYDGANLYEYALEYDSIFWDKYTLENPVATIPAAIRRDMETEKTLERQFADKQRRDTTLLPPVAPRVPAQTTLHGDTRTDDYAWLKDPKRAKSNRQIMDYLHAENDYFDNYFIPLRKQQRALYSAMAYGIEENYVSLPTRDNGYSYNYTYSEEQEHPVYFRWPTGKPTERDTLIDVNVGAAENDGYYSIAGLQVSPDNRTMAFAENTTGSDRYVLKFKDLETGELLGDSLLNVGDIVWTGNRRFMYSELDPATLRSYRIRTHKLDNDPKNDPVIFTETDPTFGVSCSRSQSKEFYFINSSSSTSTEIYYRRADAADDNFTLVEAREEDHQYGLLHSGKQFFVYSNRKAPNGQILTTDTSNVSRKNWEKLIPHRAEVMISDFAVFDNYLVINEKENVQHRLRIIDRRSQDEHFVKLKEDFYEIGIGYNPDTDTDSLRFSYSSFTTPATVVDYHMGTRESREVKKAKGALGLDYGKYVVEREYATAADGTQIPITLIYDKWRGRGKKSTTRKLYLTSYGAYGSSSGVGFSQYTLALMRGGFTVAIAHVRGGSDLGRKWYDDGRLLKKKNTFTDFIACAEYLIAEGYTEAGKITAEGGSAGGLLMGAIANMRPELFKTIVLNVPFVDALSTMLDDKLPLTTGEYQEWGNPNDPQYYKYIKSYSPYDNVQARNYPNMLFFTGLNDSRVGYWEPAKMAAKLRATKTDDNVLLLKTDMNAGHGGGAGRYAGLQEAAYRLALISSFYSAR